MSLRTRLVLLFTFVAIVVGAAGGLLLARRLQLGLVSDLDGVMRQRAQEVSASTATGKPDLSAAEGPVQLLGPGGTVLLNAGGASPSVPLLNPEQLHRATDGVLIIDATAWVGDHAEQVRVLGRPAAVGGEVVVVAVNRDPVDDVVQRTGVELTLLGTPATLLIAFGVWLVTGAALRPVERMRAQAASASPSERTVLSVPSSGDELARLAVTLNDLLAAQQAALRAEQSFLADAGHELRTPLAILAGELEYADRPMRTEAELRETITVAREETTRLVRLAEQLLVLARTDDAELRRAHIDLRALAQQAVSAWTATARTRDVRLELHPGPTPSDGPDGPTEPAGRTEPGVPAWADADRIRQVIDNLLANALRVAPPGTRVEITVRSVPASASASASVATAEHPGPKDGSGTANRPAVLIAVRDHGPGFPPGFLPQAFERFRRADPARSRGGPALPDGAADSSGTGLGLAVVRSIAAAHGGSAQAQDCPDGGAVVSVLIPVDES